MTINLARERARSQTRVQKRDAEIRTLRRGRYLLDQAPPGANRTELEEAAVRHYGSLPDEERAGIIDQAERLQAERKAHVVLRGGKPVGKRAVECVLSPTEIAFEELSRRFAAPARKARAAPPGQKKVPPKDAPATGEQAASLPRREKIPARRVRARRRIHARKARYPVVACLQVLPPSPPATESEPVTTDATARQVRKRDPGAADTQRPPLRYLAPCECTCGAWILNPRAPRRVAPPAEAAPLTTARAPRASRTQPAPALTTRSVAAPPKGAAPVRILGLCACGCGDRLVYPGRGRPPRYLPGHRARAAA